jgi:hypothetical protein
MPCGFTAPATLLAPPALFRTLPAHWRRMPDLWQEKPAGDMTAGGTYSHLAGQAQTARGLTTVWQYSRDGQAVWIDRRVAVRPDGRVTLGPGGLEAGRP